MTWSAEYTSRADSINYHILLLEGIITHQPNVGSFTISIAKVYSATSIRFDSIMSAKCSHVDALLHHLTHMCQPVVFFLKYFHSSIAIFLSQILVAVLCAL